MLLVLRSCIRSCNRHKLRLLWMILLSFSIYILLFQNDVTGNHDLPKKSHDESLYYTVPDSFDCVYYANCLHVLPFKAFSYPLNINMSELVQKHKAGEKLDVNPIFVYPFFPVAAPTCKCGCIHSNNDIHKKDILLMLIKSAPPHYERRQAIRSMWGNENQTEIKDLKIEIKTVFLIGSTGNKTLHSSISSEIKQYSDIIWLSYIDNYYNNTYKTIGGLNWAVKNCSQAKFLMFVDDDFYVNPVLIIKHLEGLSNTDIKKLFLGKVWYDIPQRGPKQKWYMPVAHYPFNKYPPFLSAGCMIISTEFATDLQIAIQYTKKFKFDDVFLAITVYKLGATPQHSDFIRISSKTSFKEKDFDKVLAAHGYSNLSDLHEAWKIYKKNHS